MAAAHLFDDGHGLGCDLAEDDVLAIEPVGLDGAEEELRPVGVGASVGHGQDAGAGVLELKVLVGKLLAVDGLSTSALRNVSTTAPCCIGPDKTYVATGEVTALEHELRDDTVEGRPLVSEALLLGAESAEVLGSLGDYIIKELKVDTASAG